MEANRTCTLPEITSSPLKIKCYTLILILLPRLYLFMSLTTPKWNYDLVCTAWTHTELPRLVWKAMHHVGLYSADFVICSNPQRIRNKRHSVFMLYSPATYPHQTWVLPREIAEIQKKYSLIFCCWPSDPVRDFRRCWNREFTGGQTWSEWSTVWRPNRNTMKTEEVRPEAVAYSVICFFSQKHIFYSWGEGSLLGILQMRLSTLS